MDKIFDIFKYISKLEVLSVDDYLKQNIKNLENIDVNNLENEKGLNLIKKIIILIQ